MPFPWHCSHSSPSRKHFLRALEPHTARAAGRKGHPRDREGFLEHPAQQGGESSPVVEPGWLWGTPWASPEPRALLLLLGGGMAGAPQHPSSCSGWDGASGACRGSCPGLWWEHLGAVLGSAPPPQSPWFPGVPQQPRLALLWLCRAPIMGRVRGQLPV